MSWRGPCDQAPRVSGVCYSCAAGGALDGLYSGKYYEYDGDHLIRASEVLNMMGVTALDEWIARMMGWAWIVVFVGGENSLPWYSMESEVGILHGEAGPFGA